MPTYLWTGKYSTGEPFALNIDAATASAARAELESRGCTNLKLHKGDVASAVHGLFNSSVIVSAEQQLRLRQKGLSTVRRVLWKSLKEFPIAYTTCAIVLGVMLSARQLIIAALCIVTFIALFLYRTWFSLPGLFFAWMIKAKEWHQWEKVLKWCKRIEQVSKWGNKPLPTYSLAYYRAQARAGLGDLHKALLEFQQFEADPQVPKWLYLSQLASIYDVVQDHDKAISLARQALELSPSNASLYSGLATRLIRRKRDPAAAKGVLAQAEGLPIVEHGRPFRFFTNGLIALEEGKPKEAAELLSRALDEFQRIAQHAFIPGLMRLTKAYLSIAVARCGDLKRARRLFEPVKVYLVALKEEDLLKKCEQCIREAGQPGC